MRLNTKWLAVLLLSAAIPLSGCGFMQKLRCREKLTKGSKAFTEQKYEAAASYFKDAVELDPNFETARMYLATAYTYQFVPGSTDPKSEEMAKKGIATFQEVIDRAQGKEPSDNVKNAMLAIANLYYQLKNYPESKQWCNKAISVDPNNAEAWYRIAVMDYDDSLEQTGVEGELVDMMTPDAKTKTQGNIEDGLKALDKAISIRPNYFDAMEYQNLLWREKAKFEKDPKAKAELERQADLVYQKATALKLKAQEEEAKKPKKLGALGGGK